MKRKVFWPSGNVEKSVLALGEWQEKFVLVLREWDCGDGKNKCYGVAGVTICPPSAAIKSELRFWT